MTRDTYKAKILQHYKKELEKELEPPYFDFEDE
jgi:hypothetical protein